MGLMRTCDHDGPGGRLFRFCGACGMLIHPQTTPLRRCEERHGLKRDLGYAFCVDCGASVSDARGWLATRPSLSEPSAAPAPSEPIAEVDPESEEGPGANILDFPSPVRE